jgi:hypothetical protein
MRYALCALTLLTVGISGCQFGPKANHYPADPLLVSKTPVEGKRGDGVPLRLTYAEPSAPPVPQLALAMRTAAAP